MVLARNPELVDRADGRRVAVYRTGSPDRPAVLLYHGMPGTGGLVLAAATAADDLGLCLVGVNRPGYEDSTPAPPGFPTVIEDALFVADRLGLHRFAVLGFSGGAPFAAATAAAAPDRISALGIAAGLGAWRLVEPPETWDPADAAAIELAESGALAQAHAMLREQVERGFGPLLRLSDEQLAGALMPPAAAGEPSGDPAFRSWWVPDARAALASFDGIIYDNLTIGMPWDWSPEQIRQPTWLWYGGADTLVPVAHGRWYERHIGTARLRVRPADGHGRTMYSHWTEMLLALSSVR